jgi:uncharacterized repeat protein (TIGR04138 family)
MQDKVGINEAVEMILETDPRFHRDAYHFVREVLDLAVEKLGRAKSSRADRHVSGPEMLMVFKEHALAQFGPMVPIVLETWGIRSCFDVGSIVYNLIGSGILGKSESDRIEDFKDVFDFHKAFVAPFLGDPGNNMAPNR